MIKLKDIKTGPKKGRKIGIVRLLLTTFGALGLALAFLCAAPLATETANAADFYLIANTTTATMPDTGEVVTMWGFANATSGGAQDGPVMVPGPALRMPVGDTTLNIHLFNALPENISLQIPGLIPTAQTPVKIDTDGTGRLRAKSLTAETTAGNTAAVTYTWDVRPGTHMYMSATNPAKQIQMGLYGAVISDFGINEAYGGVTYDSEVILFFSEIDPAIHAAIAADDYGSGKTIKSSIRYDAKYFLINGGPYPSPSSLLKAGNSGETTLIRFLNASLETHVPLLQGMYMNWIAEDGWTLPYPQERYALVLPAGKTLDAIIAPSSGGKYPIYDRRLNLTNSSYAGGGMLAYLGIDMHLLTVVKAGLGNGTVTSADGGINCGFKCSELYDDTVLSVVLNAVAAPGSVFAGWSGGGCTGTAPCTVDLTGDITVTATFTGLYSISGTVRTSAGTPISGATVSLAGTATSSTTTDAAGNYSFIGIGNGSYTISPSVTGYTFVPSSRSVTIFGGSLTNQNFTGSASAPVYSISGKVTDAGAPVSGVTMTLSGDASRAVLTGPLGQYIFRDLADGNYTVTPSKTGYAFTPVSNAVVIAGANITGINFSVAGTPTPTYSISGSVRTSGGAPVSGVTIALSGDATATTATNPLGRYSFSGLLDGSYDLTPIKTGYDFTPASITGVAVSGANVTEQNFTASASVAPASMGTSISGVGGAGGTGTAAIIAADSYTVSGRVLAGDGTPLEGVAVTLGGDTEGAALSDAKGYYRFIGLKDGSYALSAEKEGYEFLPSEIAVTVNGSNVRGRNFTAR